VNEREEVGIGEKSFSAIGGGIGTSGGTHKMFELPYSSLGMF
jgi:hypothetical protein